MNTDKLKPIEQFYCFGNYFEKYDSCCFTGLELEALRQAIIKDSAQHYEAKIAALNARIEELEAQIFEDLWGMPP